jgi:hypothetical protein
MSTRSLRIKVTEPTMSNGVWQLAAFEWVSSWVFPRHEVEDNDLPWPAHAVVVQTDLRVAFDDWLDTMPRVERMDGRLVFNEHHAFYDDTRKLFASARGWFALSDDEQATERMLALVNTDKIEGMTPLYYVGPAEELFHRERQRSLLRPRTSDNDMNPNFTTGPLRVHRRYSVDWADLRNPYGTMEDTRRDGIDAMRRLLEAYPEFHNDIPSPPVPQLSDDRRERDDRAMAALIDAAMLSTHPPMIAGDGASPLSDPATDSSGTTGDST